MEINTEYLNLKINGAETKLELLTFEQAENILDKMQNIDDKKPKEVLRLQADVLISSGLDEVILKKLQMSHVKDIFNAVVGLEKN